MSIKERAKQVLNLEQYNSNNLPENVGELELETPKERQYILRMLIKRMFGDFQIPEELEWTRPIVEKAYEYQLQQGIKQPFCYITVRNGIVNTTTDDAWHVDGFSQSITHLPEQNYIWTDREPTEYIVKAIDFPKDFDSLKHNIHYFFDDIIDKDEILTCKEKNIYCLDPYIIHRRPKVTQGIERCFIRVSFTPIEIEDINNTINPLIPTNYTRDGVGVRNKLTRYEIKKP